MTSISWQWVVSSSLCSGGSWWWMGPSPSWGREDLANNSHTVHFCVNFITVGTVEFLIMNAIKNNSSAERCYQNGKKSRNGQGVHSWMVLQLEWRLAYVLVLLDQHVWKLSMAGSEDEWKLLCVVRGDHAYKDVWSPHVTWLSSPEGGLNWGSTYI